MITPFGVGVTKFVFYFMRGFPVSSFTTKFSSINVVFRPIGMLVFYLTFVVTLAAEICDFR